MILYLKNTAEYVKDLEHNLTKLTVQVVTFYSRKKQIDRFLQTAVFKEKTDEYHVLVKQFQGFEERYNKLIHKYNKHCRKLPVAAVYGPDLSTLIDVIDALRNRKPTVLTRKFFTLAALSRNIIKLHEHVSEVTDIMKAENLTIEKEIEPVDREYDVVHRPSFAGYVEKILSYLSEDENRTVGVLGPVGVGKTIVMKMLSNRLREDSLKLLQNGVKIYNFEVVIWINCSEFVDAKHKNIIGMMQVAIMERLRLIEEKKTDNIEVNANIISTFLMHKKYLLLVDQVSSTIDFDRVGIHKQHKLGKIVVASSSKNLFKEMIDRRVEILPLSNDDSLLLFRKFCGTSYGWDFKIIAEDIVASSGGLPEVIMAVAENLKGEKDTRVWSYVRNMLKCERRTLGDCTNLRGLANAYKSVYDKLGTSSKRCLLFAASFPRGVNINKDYLVEYLIKDPKFLEEDTQELARARGGLVLRDLADEYLLENCSDVHVKVPVFVRRVVLAQKCSDEERGARAEEGGLKKNHRQPSKYRGSAD